LVITHSFKDCLIFHTVIIFHTDCESFDYHDPVFLKLDFIFHQTIPTLIILISSIGLLLRVLWQKTLVELECFNGDDNENYQFRFYRLP
jgi:hypothetical protein